MKPGKRMLPFGYAYRQGRSEADPKEAEIVRQLFEQYLAGASYKTLAEYLSLGEVPYHPGNPVWNKNMVKRILEDRRYLGEDGLPALMEASTFHTVEKIRLGKTAGFVPPPEYVKHLRGHVVCAVCGKRLLRDTKRHARWVCAKAADNDGGRLHPVYAVREGELTTGIQALLNRLTGSPSLVTYPAAEIGAAGTEAIRLANELRRETERRGCDEARAIALILAFATEQYALCDSGEAMREAKRLRERFAAAVPQTAFDLALFLDTVKQVAVHPDDCLSLILTTGQRIASGSDDP